MQPPDIMLFNSFFPPGGDVVHEVLRNVALHSSNDLERKEGEKKKKQFAFKFCLLV